MQYNKTNWPFRETPWSSERTCSRLKVIWTNDLYASCISAIVLDFTSAYILPVLLILSLTINITLASVLIASNRKTRSIIYFIGSIISNILVNIAFGWFWYYLTKGLPYATDGQKYFFLLYASDDACRLFRFSHSFSSTLMCNFLLSAAVDRCLTIYMPIRFANLPNKFAWYTFVFVFIISFLMTLPFAIVSGLFIVSEKIHCWVRPDTIGVLFYHAIITNMGPFQLSLTIIINIMFFLRIRYQLRKMNSLKGADTIDRKKIQGSIFLLLLSASYALFGVPQGIVYIINRANLVGFVNANAVLCQNIGDIIWNLFFSRSLLDIALSYLYFKPVREACSIIHQHCTKMSRKSSFTSRFSTKVS
ncbi:unnamed protein product [Trichobilharzia regenti]|nr:unnamed protein product [Trichobilharzia regenti]